VAVVPSFTVGPRGFPSDLARVWHAGWHTRVTGGGGGAVSLIGVGGLVILAAAVVIGITRRRGRRMTQSTVYRMISPSGPVDTFDLGVPPSPARVMARGEALVALLTRQHMAGSGTAWFEPTSPLIFALDSGDAHVIPRKHIKAVERQDDGTLKITLSPASPLWMVVVEVRSEDDDAWRALVATGDPGTYGG
jgi:hypothetical protein